MTFAFFIVDVFIDFQYCSKGILTIPRNLGVSLAGAKKKKPYCFYREVFKYGLCNFKSGKNK
ncbi:hypothetical protein, partial [Enterobacter hormaechei]